MAYSDVIKIRELEREVAVLKERLKQEEAFRQELTQRYLCDREDMSLTITNLRSSIVQLQDEKNKISNFKIRNEGEIKNRAGWPFPHGDIADLIKHQKGMRLDCKHTRIASRWELNGAYAKAGMNIVKTGSVQCSDCGKELQKL